MNKEKQILEELKQTFPQLEFLLFSTRQRGDRKLIVVRGFSAGGDLDYWSIEIVYPIWHKMLEILERYDGGMRDFRLLFVRGNQFMLHSPDVGFGAVFREFHKPISIDVYGYEDRRHYVGECQKIIDVVEYLQQTEIWF